MVLTRNTLVLLAALLAALNLAAVEARVGRVGRNLKSTSRTLKNTSRALKKSKDRDSSDDEEVAMAKEKDDTAAKEEDTKDQKEKDQPILTIVGNDGEFDVYPMGLCQVWK